MKNILTIAATAGLLATFTGSVHAAPPTSSTTFATAVGPVCTVSIPATAGLTANAALATSLTGSTTATVNCNQSGKSLTVAVDSLNSTVFNGTPGVALNGGTGNFVGATGLTKAITTTTGAGGDTANINALVSGPAGGAALQAGSYAVVVNATITP